MAKKLRKKIWTNPQYAKGKRKYVGFHEVFRGERFFVLEGLMKNGKTHRKEYSSHEDAKLVGWVSQGFA